MKYTLPNDWQFNLEFQFKSIFKLEFQAEFGIQPGIPIPMGINLGECTFAENEQSKIEAGQYNQESDLHSSKTVQ